MRVIAGDLKGRKILDPLDKSTRPLKDLVRESIFNILEHSKYEYIKLRNGKILDLFSGTGSFGIECLSRGAKQVFFFENYSKSIEILKKNIFKLNLESKSKIFNESVYNINEINFIYKNFDIIFLDPPFIDKNINQIIIKLKKLKIANDKTILILHRNKKIKEKTSENFKIFKEKNYGLSKVIFGKIF